MPSSDGEASGVGEGETDSAGDSIGEAAAASSCFRSSTVNPRSEEHTS